MCELDKTDNAILEILKQDARTSYSEIGKRVHLSRVAVSTRISEMEKNGIIAGYTVIVNSKAYNKLVSVFLEIEVKPDYIVSVANELTNFKEVAIISQQTGFSGLHVHLYLERIDELHDYLIENIYSIDGVMRVKSSLLIKQFKTNVYLSNNETNRRR
ncbi:MAG: Lrp/AsnC family transcriptional regulator [Tissierellia bacterium]|nr:Lrp/AsnC family transcriptional regulator [Tissierellia bacterium]